jgi:hypothetical protein
MLLISKILHAKLSNHGDPKVFNAETVTTGGLLLIILCLCEGFRQQFYLDWKQERGVHLRAGLLQFAKWPYVIMAFFDVVFARRFPYVTTSKMSGAPCASLALWPHIPALIIIGVAWGIGLSIHETVPVEVQFGAGAFVIATQEKNTGMAL